MKKFVSLLMILCLTAGGFTPAAAAGIPDIPLSYFDEGAYPVNSHSINNFAVPLPASMSGGLGITADGNMTAPTVSSIPAWVDTNTRQTPSFNEANGRDADDAALRLATVAGQTVDSSNNNLSAMPFFYVQGSQPEIEPGDKILMSFDFATSDMAIQKTVGMYSRNTPSRAATGQNGRTAFPFLTIDTDGTIKAKNGAGDTNTVIADYKVGTWYNVIIEFFVNDSRMPYYNVYINGVKKAENYGAYTSTSANPNNSNLSRGMIYYLDYFRFTITPEANAVAVYDDLYIDNLSLDTNSAFTQDFYKASRDAAELSFTGDMSNGNVAKNLVATDLTLPASGYEGSTVSWASDRPDIISTHGSVNAVSEPTDVTLTATVTSGAKALTKVFYITVVPLESVILELDAASLTFDTIRGDNRQADRIFSSLSLPDFVGEGNRTSVTWSSADTAAVTNDGIVTRKADEFQAVTLSALLSYSGRSVTKTFELKVMGEVFVDYCEDFSLADSFSNMQTATESTWQFTGFMSTSSDMAAKDYVIYRVSGMTGFQVTTTENTRAAGFPGDTTFEIADESGEFVPYSGAVKSESIGDIVSDGRNASVGGWYHFTYTAENLPVGTEYLKIIVADRTPTEKLWTYQIDTVAIYYDAASYAYTWPSGAGIYFSDITNSSLHISWEDLGGSDLEYEVYADGVPAAVTADSYTSLNGLSPNTSYRIGVLARNKNDSTLHSRLLGSVAVRTSRDRGYEVFSEASPALPLSLPKTDIIDGGAFMSALVTLSLGADISFGYSGYIQVAFANAAVNIYADKTVHLKGGRIIHTQRYLEGTAGKTLTLVTEDTYISDSQANIELSVKSIGAAGGSVTCGYLDLYRLPAGTVYYEALEEFTPANGFSAELPVSVLESFTFEADIRANSGSSGSLTIALYSSVSDDVGSPLRLTQTTLSAASSNWAYQYNAMYGKGTSNMVLGGYVMLPSILKTDTWVSLKIYADVEAGRLDVYHDNVLIMEDLYFTHEDAVDLKSITIGLSGGAPDFSIRGMRVTGGYHGLFVKPVRTVDEYDNDVVSLKDGQTLKGQFEALYFDADNAAPASDMVLWGMYGGDVKRQPVSISNLEAWHSYEILFDITSDTENVKLYLWDKETVVPITKRGGYYPSPVIKEKATVFLMGDSTVENYSDSTRPLRKGWGQVLSSYVTGDLTVRNISRGGMSSRTYIDSGRHTLFENEAAEGDYLIVQLGHNDRCSGNPTLYRHTVPGSTYDDMLRKYIVMARNKGVHIIFVTPATVLGDAFSQTESDLSKYAKAMLRVAAEENVPCIDLYNKSRAEFNALGRDYCNDNVYMYNVNVVGAATPEHDGTHFQDTGARLLAQYVMELMEEAGIEFARFKNF